MFLRHLAVRVRGLDKNLVPEEIRQILLEHHREQVFSTLRMTAELFRLLELFAANEIPTLIVKGPALAMQAYGDPTMRSYRRSRLPCPPARHPPRHRILAGCRLRGSRSPQCH